jgi:hypothetical protein
MAGWSQGIFLRHKYAVNPIRGKINLVDASKNERKRNEKRAMEEEGSLINNKEKKRIVLPLLVYSSDCIAINHEKR